MNENQEGRRVSAKREPYFGSVRFFKHLILIVLALLILIPTSLAIAFGIQIRSLKAQIRELTEAQAQHPTQSAMADGVSYGSPSTERTSLTQSGETQHGEAQSGDAPEAPEAVTAPSETTTERVIDDQDPYPDLYAPAADLDSIDQEKTVYLTFDDGPSARTDEILDILDEYGIKATFFVIGKEDEESLQRMREIVARGHTLGVHSYSHDYQKIYASLDAYLEDFNRIYHLVLDATGTAPTVFRFPGGSVNSYNKETCQEIIEEMTRRGFVYFDWNVSSGDATNGSVSAASLRQNSLQSVNSLRRAIVLMHDSAPKTSTVEALPGIIEGYQNAGFTFAALTAEVKPVIYRYPD
jgi:peptidoglycan/xylan/chitin deacetylase (PgdA/CDA1 family)